MRWFIVLNVPVVFMILSAAVIYNFLTEAVDDRVQKYQKTPVDTLTMYAVIGLMYICFWLSYQKGFEFLKFKPPLGLQLIGTFLVDLGLVVNILGRLTLKGQWSNMIKIKASHEVIQTGVFRFVRHPLYASTIWIVLGSGLVYGNKGILTLLCFVFYPMMIYRAKQEELALTALEGYKDYLEKTGRFFPKLIK